MTNKMTEVPPFMDVEERALYAPSPDLSASLAEMIEGLVEQAEYWPETSKHWEARAIASEARVSELQVENEKLREATDEAIRLARYQLNRGSEDMGIGESDTLRRMVAELPLSGETRALAKDHPNGQG